MNKVDQIKFAVTLLFDQGFSDVADQVFSADYLAHSGNKVHKGHQFIKQFAKMLRTAIPDIKVLNIEILAQSDNCITWQRTFGGIHKAKMMGIPASNRKVKWYEMVVTRFENDKIIEEWVVSDLAFQLMLKQK